MLFQFVIALLITSTSAKTEFFGKADSDDVHANIRFEFELNVEIGTPSKTFKLAIDLQSDESWIYAVSCRTCHSHWNINHYDYLSSKTFKNVSTLFSKTYSSESYNKTSIVNGYVANDEFQFSREPAGRYNFNLITQLKDEDMTEDAYGDHHSGLAGFGFPSNGDTKWIGNIAFKGEKKVICLGNYGDGLAFRSFGGFPSFHHQNLSSLAVTTSSGKWTVKIGGQQYGRVRIGRPTDVAISTLTPYIHVSKAIFSAVMRELIPDNQNGEKVVDCAKNATALPLRIQAGDVWLDVEPKRYLRKIKGSENKCLLLIKQSKLDTELTFGTSFLDDHPICVNYDQKLLHFLKVIPVIRTTTAKPKIEFGI
ncbi:unnamed protein product [Bursaphelenchus xylophilus]|uniref:(pine wood nematode) hypothetical protein n=1 Tax=Bursaphelenchus xylophilus TaxID=6326 RepID=A0A1I7SEY9_BURXY|nr:unnamed protein product [Bursaphelenchus xylophilus]CAG9113692.1 unnamed protein product [Bursaphelenchus xylophilus]